VSKDRREGLTVPGGWIWCVVGLALGWRYLPILSEGILGWRYDHIVVERTYGVRSSDL
jgi:hypothetical protein